MDESGKAIDYEFLDINDAFAVQTGISREQVIGKRATKVLLGIEKDPADWISRYGLVAINQESMNYESYSESLDKTYSVRAYSPEKGYFATIFTDITDRIKAEEDRLRLLKIESSSI